MKIGDIFLIGLVGLVAIAVIGNREIQQGNIGPIGRLYGGLFVRLLGGVPL